MIRIITLEACVDCVAFEANGDIPEDRPNLPDEVQAHLCLSPRQYLASASGLDERGEYYRDADDNEITPDHPDYEARCEDWFSWSPCECCGSTLGGGRNRLAILECE